jgi:membrane protease YdiL (CAAX protease family)
MALAFTQLGTRYGPRRGYLLGFLVYWLGWCGLFPLWILGRRGRAESLRPAGPAGRLPAAGVAALAVPPLFTASVALPRQLPRANAEIVLESLALAAVNATGEELLWRACYQQGFPEGGVAGTLYPVAGFALWHLAPQLVRPSSYPGGAAGFVAFSGGLGLLYGWAARRGGSIRWTTLSHTLLDFSGLGARAFRQEAGPVMAIAPELTQLCHAEAPVADTAATPSGL